MHGLTVLCMYINDTLQARWYQMLEVILVYVGVQALIMLYGRGAVAWAILIDLRNLQIAGEFSITVLVLRS